MGRQRGLTETMVASMPVAIRKFLLAQWDATTKDFAAELLFDSKEVVAE